MLLVLAQHISSRPSLTLFSTTVLSHRHPAAFTLLCGAHASVISPIWAPPNQGRWCAKWTVRRTTALRSALGHEVIWSQPCREASTNRRDVGDNSVKKTPKMFDSSVYQLRWSARNCWITLSCRRPLHVKSWADVSSHISTCHWSLSKCKWLLKSGWLT